MGHKYITEWILLEQLPICEGLGEISISFTVKKLKNAN